MNGKLALSGVSLVISIAILSACGGGSSGSSGSTSPAGDSTTTPPSNAGSNTGGTPPPDGSAGGQQPASVAGYVYGVNPYGNRISGYAIDASTGSLSAIPGGTFPTGDGPLGLTPHPSGRFLYFSNMLSNDIWAYAINAATGVLSNVPGSPYAAAFARPDSALMHPSGRFVYVPSGGFESGAVSDEAHGTPGKIFGYSIDAATGALSPIAGSPFPSYNRQRMFTFNREGTILYLVSADDGIASLYTYAINASTGALAQVGAGVEATSGPLMITPSGEFAYTADRMFIRTYRIDSATGVPVRTGDDVYLPTEGVVVAPSGRFIYATGPQNEGSVPTIAVFAIDPATGSLSQTPGSPFAFPPAWAGAYTRYYPALHPSGRFLYLDNDGKEGVYTLDPDSGAPSEIAGSPFVVSPAGNGASYLIDPSGRVGYVKSCDTDATCDLVSATINQTTGAPTPISSLPVELDDMGSLTIVIIAP